jgi:PKD repeat protein
VTTTKTKSHSFLKFSAIALLATSLGVSADTASENFETEPTGPNKPFTSIKVSPKNLDVDLRSLPTATQWQVGDAIKDMPRPRFNPNFVVPGAPKNTVLNKNDQLVTKQMIASQQPSENARALEQTIDGEGYTGVNPPDPSGDVGLNYYIQSINGNSGSIFSVYNKTNGSKVAGPINMETLGSGQCASGAGDPIILFDEMAGRWMLSEFSSSGNNLCVYISKTSDPVSGGWYAYAFASPTFPDYPKYGVGTDAYYVGTNESSPTVYALNRTAMLSGASANFVRLTAPKLAGFGFQIVTPADHDGTTAMNSGSSGYFLRHRDDEVHNSSSNNASQDYIEIWKFSPDFNTTSNSTFSKVSDIAVSEFDSSLCGLTSFSCFPQSGSSSDMDPLREPMFKVQYRNFGSYEVLLGNFVTDVNGSDHGGIRWFELRKSGSSAWSLHQEGTYSPDSKNRWMGSIAMDKDGNVALAYSWGSSSDYPGLRYTGRLAGDANGTMSQPEAVLVNGTSGVSSNRWGDYSQMSIDPVDECTFWYTNEYGKSSGQWGTHISKFKFDSCGSGGGGNASPIASFTNSCTELACTFDGSASSDSDGTIASYAWNFGDGSTASGANASHTYSAAGTYTATLTVTDDLGATGVSNQSVTVSVTPLPGDSVLDNGVAKTNLSGAKDADDHYTMEVPAGVTGLNFVIAGGSGDADLYVRFGAAPTTSTYDCRPYKGGNEETCSIATAQAGTYYVMVRAYTAYSGLSLTGSYTTTTNQAPTASFTDACTGLACSFNGTASSDSDGTIASYAWNFGDSSTGTGSTASHTYAADGTYTVQLTVTDNDGATNTSSTSVTVSAPVNQAPTAAFTDSCTNLACSFNGSASSDSDGSIASYAWDFGDGSTGTGVNPSHSYSAAGAYGVQLTVTDNQGATNSISKTVTVTDAPTGGNVLVNGTAKTNLSGAKSEETFYTMVVPAGATGLSFSMSGGTGDADMYVRFGSAPTTGTYDCRPYKGGNSETCNITTAQAGTYHVMLRGYSTYSGVSLTGSYTEGGTGGNGGSMSQSNLSGTTSAWDRYTVEIPAGMASLVVTISGGSGDADLYVRAGSQPTTSAYDCRPYKNGNAETCTITNPAAGTMHIGLRAYSTYSGVSLNAEWNP